MWLRNTGLVFFAIPRLSFQDGGFLRTKDATKLDKLNLYTYVQRLGLWDLGRSNFLVVTGDSGEKNCCIG